MKATKDEEQVRRFEKTIMTEIACNIPSKEAIKVGYKFDNLMKLYSQLQSFVTSLNKGSLMMILMREKIV